MKEQMSSPAAALVDKKNKQATNHTHTHTFYKHSSHEVINVGWFDTGSGADAAAWSW